MKIRDLNKYDRVIVHDLGKSEYSEGMTVVGNVTRLANYVRAENEEQEDGYTVAVIEQIQGIEYVITDDNHFYLWSNYIESKTESLSKKDNINRGKVKLIDSETVEFENGKQMKVIVNNGKQPTSVYWIDNTIIEFDNGSRVTVPENYKTEDSHDTVNYPSHYNYGDIETIDFIEQVTQHYNPNVAYHIGNAIKYLARSPHKNGKEDVAKAKWYIERAFENWDVK